MLIFPIIADLELKRIELQITKLCKLITSSILPSKNLHRFSIRFAVS
jgi:hypothetical protein